MTSNIHTIFSGYFYEIAVDFDKLEVVQVVRIRKHHPTSPGELLQYSELDEQTKDHLRPLIRNAYNELKHCRPESEA